MNCEIEFLPVGEASKAGDAIVIRYGTADSYSLMVIDGGNLESGKLIVEHIRQQFGSSAVVSHIILTHSDADHASGLREVLREIPVMNIWLHIPWLHAADTRLLFKDKHWTDNRLQNAIKKEYDIISEIVDLALAKKCNIYCPFQGCNIGPFHVLSPSLFCYRYLLPQFDKTPDPDQGLIEAAQMWLGKQLVYPLRSFFDTLVAKTQKWVPEKWEYERLKDGGLTSASNETSVVLYGSFDNNHCVLLTGDAGINALTWAADYAEASGLPLRQFSFVQVPHHGSRRNVGPTILNRILGPIQPQGFASRFSAFVSAPKDDDTHPRKMVLNAFIRRGGVVIATQGNKKVFWGGFPARPGYIVAEAMSFASYVEEYD